MTTSLSPSCDAPWQYDESIAQWLCGVHYVKTLRCKGDIQFQQRIFICFYELFQDKLAMNQKKTPRAGTIAKSQ